MTENEWMKCADPVAMLAFAQPSSRKLRLFACACCRRIWDRLDDACRAAIEGEEAVEYHLPESGAWLAKRQAFLEARAEVVANLGDDDSFPAPDFCREEEIPERLQIAEVLTAANAVRGVVLPVENRIPEAIREVARSTRTFDEAGAWDAQLARGSEADEEAYEFRGQAAVLREIVGNPFQQVYTNPNWFTTDVKALAKSVIVRREFSAMPILADALQEAGCESTEVLDHCRNTNASHVRGVLGHRLDPRGRLSSA